MFKEILASTAIAVIAALTSGPSSANALVAGHSDLGHVARHFGASAPHHTVVHRKRNAHRQRRACIQHPVGDTPGPSPSPPANNPPANNPPANNPPPANNGAYAGRSKVGLAWAPDVPKEWIRNMVQSANGNIGYVYNWSPWKFEPEILAGAKFAPMLWGWDQVGQFEQLVQPGFSDVVLGPNEVNQDGQAYMSEGNAADLWNRHIGPRRAMGYRLGSPCTTNAPGGLEWIANWINMVGEKPDFIAIHWYGVDINDFKNYAIRTHEMFGRPIWITEYACTDFSYQRGCDVWAFTQEATNWMDQQSWIEAYFQFGFVGDLHGVSEVNRLVDLGTGWPTGLGSSFLN